MKDDAGLVRSLDARYYTDPQVFEAEKAGLWPAHGNSPAMPARSRTRAITWPSTSATKASSASGAATA
jgi:hypothetical protein